MAAVRFKFENQSMKIKSYLINIDCLWKIEPIPPAIGASKWCAIESDAHKWAEAHGIELIRARKLDVDRNLERFPEV